MGKKIKFSLVFALLLCLSLTGCQTSQLQEAKTESQTAQNTDTREAQQEDEYIDADYVDENYDDAEEDPGKYQPSRSKDTDTTGKTNETAQEGN